MIFLKSSNVELLKLIKFLHKNIPERTNGIRTTITVYNSVNSEYVREATDRLNTKIQEHEQERKTEQDIDDDLSDEEIERQIRELEKLQERKRRRKEKDFEM